MGSGGGSCWVPLRAAELRRPERRRGRGDVQPSPRSAPSFHPWMHMTSVAFTAGWLEALGSLSARRVPVGGVAASCGFSAAADGRVTREQMLVEVSPSLGHSCFHLPRHMPAVQTAAPVAPRMSEHRRTGALTPTPTLTRFYPRPPSFRLLLRLSSPRWERDDA